MAIRRPRSALLGAVLALAAMLGLVALSSWHNAIVHGDPPAHVVSIEHHHHGSSKQADTDGPIHILAHATGQWTAPAGALPALILFAALSRAWLIGRHGLPAGIEPSGLLRPPRG